eukprot:CAMPEP_0117453980 /NCGR_PEP_ID=MMETSP0759-20121206/10537_1 /TAXON_ID=63605 /ORGANISM="Percolomonas cosmopolitus, Strain WS" /LENGTH=233 /DNA_ID=CAMNT_0005247097 /DNA_START=476 /DNA_END=1177 /DNA_ORIENTATION=+
MEKAGIFEKEWMVVDQQVFANMVDRIKNIQPDVSRKKKSEKKEKKMTKKEMKRLERLEKLKLKEEAAAQRRAYAAASTPGVKQVLVPPSALWYNNAQKYVEQQVGEAFAALSAETDMGKKLLLQQINTYPYKNDNLRLVLQEQHTRDYERNCDHLTAILETPDIGNQKIAPRLDNWKKWIESLDGDIKKVHHKVDNMSTRPTSGCNKRKREGDFVTDPQQAPKRAKTGVLVSI